MWPKRAERVCKPAALGAACASQETRPDVVKREKGERMKGKRKFGLHDFKTEHILRAVSVGEAAELHDHVAIGAGPREAILLVNDLDIARDRLAVQHAGVELLPVVVRHGLRERTHDIRQ